jgi:glycosyltransferase involved in cell wall biosynthesis
MMDITVVIPSIPVRPNALARAVKSAATQRHRSRGVVIAVDTEREGAAATRNRALDQVTTEWTAFLDDDDELLPNHLEVLAEAQARTGADVIYPACRVINPALGGEVPVHDDWGRPGKPFDAELLRQRSYIPVNSLVRTELAQKARFGPPANVNTIYDDWGFYVRMLDLGAKFHHVNEITWVWHHNGKNTSGQADRW